VLNHAGKPPEHLDWEQWLGGLPSQPYSDNVHPFKWRGFLDFGAGAFGDMGCHLMDAPYVALGLNTPSFVTATKVDDLTDVAWPTGSIVKLEFVGVPGHGDLPFFWYEGKKPDGTPYLPEFPASIEMGEAFKNGKISPGGWMIIGTDGVILNKQDQAKDMEIWPKKRREEFPTDKIPKSEPRSVTPGDPQQEWSEAIKRGKEFTWQSQFDYACPLTEGTLIGGLAMHFPGERLAWDSKALKITSNEAANKFIKRAAYRKGWEYSADKI
jgi:predicted dehydrogenase